jgi:hypothetical protein
VAPSTGSIKALRKGPSNAGLPDGTFSYQKSQFGQILEGLGMVNVGIVYGLLEYFTVILYIYIVVIWNMIRSFCIFSGHLVYFWSFYIFCGHWVYFVVIWYILWSFGIFLV